MFSFKKNNSGVNVPVIEEMPVAAGTYHVGDAMVTDATTGNLKLATGTAKPTHICQAEVKASAGDKIAVHPIVDGDVYQAKFSADASSLKVGAAVTIGSDGGTVTATTTGGVFTILEFNGSGASGTYCLGRF